MENWIGWIANLLIILSWWRLAYKERYALLFGIIGSILWGVKAFLIQEMDLVILEIVLAALGIHAWRKWGQDDRDTDSIRKRTTGD